MRSDIVILSAQWTLTAAVLLAVIALNLLGNLVISDRTGQIGAEFQHGWPMVFMYRRPIDFVSCMMADMEVRQAKKRHRSFVDVTDSLPLVSQVPVDLSAITSFSLLGAGLNLLAAIGIVFGTRHANMLQRRRIFQFSLRTLLLVSVSLAVLVVGIHAGWIAWRTVVAAGVIAYAGGGIIGAARCSGRLH